MAGYLIDEIEMTSGYSFKEVDKTPGEFSYNLSLSVKRHDIRSIYPNIQIFRVSTLAGGNFVCFSFNRYLYKYSDYYWSNSWSFYYARYILEQIFEHKVLNYKIKRHYFGNAYFTVYFYCEKIRSELLNAYTEKLMEVKHGVYPVFYSVSHYYRDGDKVVIVRIRWHKNSWTIDQDIMEGSLSSY